MDFVQGWDSRDSTQQGQSLKKAVAGLFTLAIPTIIMVYIN